MADPTEESLSKKFHRLWLETRSLDSSFGPDLQKKISDLLPNLLLVQKMVTELDMFSLNEDFEDLTNSTLPFLMVDALIGICFSKKFTKMEDRATFLEQAIKNYKNFKMVCLQYNLDQVKTNIPARGFSSQTADVHMRRDLLIQSNKEEKELSEAINAFLARIEKEGMDSLDDEFVRDMYLKCVAHLNIFVNREMENLKVEQGFLKNPVKVDPKKLPKNTPPARKPMIIAKNEMQKKVFGAGYPSLPSMTVEEFADYELSKAMPSQEFAIYKRQIEAMKQKQLGSRLKMDRGDSSLVQQEDQAENDEETEESLAKARRWDEFKDDHRRGEGNRMGMG